MLEYMLDVRMSDKQLCITEEMESIIRECTVIANSTLASKRNKRTYTVEKRIDEYTLRIKISSRDPVAPSRSLSALSRAVSNDERMQKKLSGHLVNGCVFSSTLVEEKTSQISFASDTDVVSEIISIFFDNTLTAKEKKLAREAADKIRIVILSYMNDKNNL